MAFQIGFHAKMQSRKEYFESSQFFIFHKLDAFASLRENLYKKTIEHPRFRIKASTSISMASLPAMALVQPGRAEKPLPPSA
jgi:hypothetical protein